MSQPKPIPRGAVWVLVALGAVALVLGIVQSIRRPGVDVVTLCVGGVVLLNAALLAQPPERTGARAALGAASLGLALVALASAFL